MSKAYEWVDGVYTLEDITRGKRRYIHENGVEISWDNRMARWQIDTKPPGLKPRRVLYVNMDDTELPPKASAGGLKLGQKKRLLRLNTAPA